MTARTDTVPGAVARGLALRRRVSFFVLMGALIGSAWVALWLWSASPYARYLDHGRWADVGVLAHEGSTVIVVLRGLLNYSGAQSQADKNFN